MDAAGYDPRMIAADGEAGALAGAAAAREDGRETDTAAGRPPASLVVLLGAMAAWGGWCIFRTSFTSGGRRVFCLFDDAMISMAYARNLVEGHGLNWARQGAPVEGFTHPLWTALMVPVNLLPIALEHRSLVVQVVSLAALMWNVVLVRRLVLRHFTLPGARHWVPACVLTAFYYPLDRWALLGMETGLQALLTTASVLLALDVVRGRRDRHLPLLLVGTLAVLLRMDMALLVLAVQVWVAACGGLRRDGTAGRRRWLQGAVALAAAVGGYTLFRWLYFHDLLPNTYYLKLGGIPLAVRLLRGGDALLDSLLAHWPLLLAVAVGLAATLAPGGRRDRAWARRLTLPAMVFLICCAWSVYVGGDVWEAESSANRFVAFAMPQVFVLFNALANQALSAAKRRLRLRRQLSRQPWQPASAGHPEGGEMPPGGPAAGRAAAGEPLALRYALVGATVAALLAANGLWQRDELEESWKTFALVTRPMHSDRYEWLLGLVRQLRRVAEPTASVAVVWAGTPAYFSDFRLVDTLGYNDRHIARGKPAIQLDEDDFDDYVPGHVKWDYAYLVNERRPDAFLQLWGRTDDDLRKVVLLLKSRGYRRLGDLWVDPRSPRIHLPPGPGRQNIEVRWR
jgi:hypothetical protein